MEKREVAVKTTMTDFDHWVAVQSRSWGLQCIQEQQIPRAGQGERSEYCYMWEEAAKLFRGNFIFG